jgi:TonB family C-terminal domain
MITVFLLKLSACWSFFALMYVLLFKGETFFRANRAYLLGTATLGILLAVWPAEVIPVPLNSEGVPLTILPEVTAGLQQAEAAVEPWENVSWLWAAYWLGFLLALSRMLWGLAKIVNMAVRGKSERLPDGCLLIKTQEAFVPFSFFKWVFVPAETSLSEGSSTKLMLAHERAHARGWHSADVLLAEICCAVFWFHPLAHWYRRELRTVHEYLADAEAAHVSDKKQYGLLLIGQSQSGMPIAFANHFFQSPLKQRLVMLTKKSSAPVRALKFSLVAPAALLFAMLFRQAPAIAQTVDEKHRDFVRQLETKGWMMVDTVITFDPDTYKETVQFVKNSAAPAQDADGKLVYNYAEIQPQFPGGQEALAQYIIDNLRYPDIAKQNKVEGTIIVWFVVDETGKVIRPYGEMAQMPNDSKLPLVEEAVRVVQSMPRWNPAQHNGKPVRCSMKLPVRFSLAAQAAKSAEAQPEFPGGMEGLVKYLTENTKYPESAKKENAEGTVIIKFTVNEDGSLSNIAAIETDKKVHQDLTAEALRLVQSMPKWKPGVQDGKVVKTAFTLPVKFKL